LPSHSPSRIRGRRAFGGVLFVPIRLRRQTFDFLVDTGAAYSAISPALASVFSLTASPRGTLTIAPVHGTPVNVPLVILPEMRGSNAHRETPMRGSVWSHLPPFSSDEFVTLPVSGEAQEVCGGRALYRCAHTIPSPFLKATQGATLVEVCSIHDTGCWMTCCRQASGVKPGSLWSSLF
jgi:hypothetical protein